MSADNKPENKSAVSGKIPRRTTTSGAESSSISACCAAMAGATFAISAAIPLAERKRVRSNLIFRSAHLARGARGKPDKVGRSADRGHASKPHRDFDPRPAARRRAARGAMGAYPDRRSMVSRARSREPDTRPRASFDPSRLPRRLADVLQHPGRARRLSAALPLLGGTRPHRRWRCDAARVAGREPRANRRRLPGEQRGVSEDAAGGRSNSSRCSN